MFRFFSIVTAIVCLILFGLFLFDAGLYIETYGVPGDNGAAFLGRRSSPLFLGLAVLLWLVRNAEPSQARAAICYAVAIIFAGVAFTGMFEFGRSNASSSIVIAAVGELILAFGFLVSARR